MYSLRRKLYTNYTQTLHSERSKPCTATLHSNPAQQPYTATLHGNPTQNTAKNLHRNPARQPCTEPYTKHRKEPAQKPYTGPCTATRWQARLSSLEGCTVSNRGQRPRTAATPQCQPGRLYAREDGGASRRAEGAFCVDDDIDIKHRFQRTVFAFSAT